MELVILIRPVFYKYAAPMALIRHSSREVAGCCCLFVWRASAFGRSASLRAMKITDIKFVAGQILLVAGIIIISIGARWSSFTGLALIMVSASFGLRSSWPRSWASRRFFCWGFSLCYSMAGMAFLVLVFSIWCRCRKPPLAALIGVWFAWIIDEFNAWRQSRRLTDSEAQTAFGRQAI